ncbi:MAG TPA: cyclic nucleotide-binding domain-containing protein [Candidatus Limnocylindria bacterium]|nr:cyclic nucleotide-binding domain-containing protein [Candidatus Limnocylindria bacterium]
MNLEQQLASTPLLAGLDRQALRRLAGHATRRTYAPGDVIVREGSTGTALYVILRGRVRVEKRGETDEAVLGELGTGEFFGELALIEEHARTASVIAVEETECLLFAAWEFRGMLETHPQIAVPIMRALIARMHRREQHPTG